MSGLLLLLPRSGDRRGLDAAFETALGALAARGPDGVRAVGGPGGRLGVAALDLRGPGDAGPASSTDGLVHLALDGRIDDREPAAETGAPPGDAASLLARYERLGEAFLDGVTGSFVVALLDLRRGEALVARDGLGSRSAWYLQSPELFALASEEAPLAAFFPVAGQPIELEPRRLAVFYANAELASSRGFFAGTRALMPGEVRIVGAGDRPVERTRALARPDPAARLAPSRWEESVEQFAELVERAVARRLRGVGRSGVLLSGGLDSSPLAVLAARLARAAGVPAPVAIHWAIDDPGAREREHAAAAAAAAGIELVEIDGRGAEPFADLSRWPIHPSTPEQNAFRWLHERGYAAAAERGIRALVWGFGGDVLYGHARRWFWDQLAAEGAGAAIDQLRALARAVGWPRALRRAVLGPILAPWRAALAPGVPAWLAPSARGLLDPPAAELRRARRPRQAARLLALLDAHGQGVEARHAARFGLELVTPLRDPDLVRFALAVPDSVLEAGDEPRRVLRAAAARWLPESILARRDKAGFLALFRRGLEPARRPWAAPLLLAPDALWRGFVDATFVRRMIERAPVGGDDDLGFCLCLYGELWRRARAGSADSAGSAGSVGALDQPLALHLA